MSVYRLRPSHRFAHGVGVLAGYAIGLTLIAAGNLADRLTGWARR